ncbi:MAG TPA: hypothetical protein DIU20_05765, partial [Cryomorphaceae bacterium]|nr:hypothetical protein [Cryomorphaceae bacterium]
IFIWTNRATLGWTTGGASNWQIEHGPPGFIPGTGTISSVSSNPGILGGLSPATSYDVYIRDSCGPGNVSLWQGPLRIKTRCAAFGTPYTRDFQGVAYSPGIFFNDTGTINSCWRRDNLINYVWKGGPPTFSPFNTGPDFDHTFGNSSGKYVFAQAIGGVVNSPNRVTNLQSSLINLTALTDPQLTFWYHMFGSDILSLQVRISTGNGVWNLERTISGQQQSAKSDPWNEVIIDLSAYTGDTIVVEFRARSLASGTASQIAIDDLNVGEAPSCPKSQNLVVTATTNNSITLNWLPGGTASFWNVEYGPVGFTPGNGTLLTATTQPFTIGSLSPNTAYDFYVRDSCGVGDVAVWTGPATDSTECNPVSAPWTENFEGTAFLPVPFAAGSIASCWNRTVTGNYIWTPGQGGTQSFGTGPDVDHTLGTSSGKFIYSEALFGVAQSISGWLETPLIDLTPLTVPEFSFWYHMFGAEIDSLVVEVSDGVSWNHEYSRVGQQQASNAAAWEEAILDLGSYAGDTIQIRFTAYKNGTFAQTVDIALDDLDIHEKPSCAKPSDLTVVGVSSGNVTLAWVTGGASDWQIEYGPNGFTPGSGTIINVNTNPFAITGLTPSTTYDFYVRDSCGVGDVSAWRGAVTTTTECLPTPAPWSEDFDGSDFIAAINFADTGTINTCWDRYPVTDYFWIPGPGPFLSIATGPSADHTSGSGKFMFTETNGFPPNLPFVTHLETPLIDLSPLSTPQLSFWYFMFGNAIGNLIVEVDNGSGYTSLQTISGAQQTSQSEPWLQSILDLSAYAGDTVQIRFKVSKSVNSTVSDVAIDDVVIDDNLLCDPPTALSIGGITTDSAEVNWNATTTGSNLVYYDQAAGPGSAVTLTDVTSPHILFGLNPNTTYVVMVFDSCAAPVFTSDTIADTISTLPCPVLISDFNYTSNELDVNFDGSLSTNADSLMWLYGDGNFASGTTSSHTYGAAGTYTVTLLSWSNCGLTDTLVQDIEVCDTLSASLASTDAFLTVNYDASASLNPDSLYWDFGDGNWSNAVQPVHNYAASGIYTVWLYTYNNCGVADSTTLNVQVCDTLLGSFSYVQDGDSVFFDGSASKGYNLLQWDFGDGTIGGAAVTSHIYS